MYLSSLTRIAYAGGINSEVLIAYEKGYFADYNINAKLIPMWRKNATLDALLQKKADVATFVYPEDIFKLELANPGTIKILKMFILDGDNKSLCLVTNKNSTIVSIEQLKGKKLGIIGTREAFYILITNMLKSVNLTLEDIELVKYDDVGLEYGNMINDLKSNRIDAAFVPQVIIPKDGKIIVSGVWSKYFMKPMIAGVMIIDANYVENNPKLVDKLRNALEKAIEFEKNNKEEVDAIFQAYNNMPRKDTGLKRSNPDIILLEKYQEILHEAGVIKNKINITNLFNIGSVEKYLPQ